MLETRGDFDYFVGIDISKDKFDACGITRAFSIISSP